MTTLNTKFIQLHKTAILVNQLDGSLQEQITKTYTDNATDYCEWLDATLAKASAGDKTDFKLAIKSVQNSLNKNNTQKAILGEETTEKVSLTQVKNPMIKAGLYPESMLGKYVFIVTEKPEPKQDDFNTAMLKLMKKHDVTMDALRTAILNENFK